MVITDNSPWNLGLGSLPRKRLARLGAFLRAHALYGYKKVSQRRSGNDLRAWNEWGWCLLVKLNKLLRLPEFDIFVGLQNNMFNFLWLWIDAWAQICLLNLYNVDWHLERTYGRVRCEMWVGLEGVEHIGPFELRLWNEANIASLWSRMVVRPMRSLGRTKSTEIFGKFFRLRCICESLKIFLVLDVSLVVEQILDRFFPVIWWPWGSAKRDLTTSKEHWMLYYKLHAGCQKPLFLVGFLLRQRGNKKPWGIWKKAGLKTTSGIAFLLMIFILFKKWLKHKCFMKKHTYILWW